MSHYHTIILLRIKVIEFQTKPNSNAMIELSVKGYYHLLLVVVYLAIVGFWLEVVAV